MFLLQSLHSTSKETKFSKSHPSFFELPNDKLMVRLNYVFNGYIVITVVRRSKNCSVPFENLKHR